LPSSGVSEAVQSGRAVSCPMCEDENDNIVYTQHIEFSDFTLDEITLWFANNVIYLPSEH